MSEDQNPDLDVSRRSALKKAAATGAGLVVGGAVAGVAGDEQASGIVERVEAKEAWFSERAFSLSGNRVLVSKSGGSFPRTTLANQIYRPRSVRTDLPS